MQKIRRCFDDTTTTSPSHTYLHLEITERQLSRYILFFPLSYPRLFETSQKLLR